MMNDFDYDLFDDLDDDIIYDDFSMSPTNLWYEEEYIDETVKVTELLELCVEPTIRDGFSHAGKLLLWCFLFRITTQLVKVPQVVCHAVSTSAGLFVLHHFFNSTMYYIIGFASGAYLLLYAISYYIKKHRGLIMGASTVTFLIGCELIYFSGIEWHKIRGAQMLIAMKVISVAFDADFGVLQHIPTPVQFAGYILCAGTCVFGPWVPFRDYMAIYNNKPFWSLKWLWRISLNIILAFIFLTVSTCWIHWFIPDDVWRWWLAYRDALSFRSSHYFISFLSEASALMSGFGYNDDKFWTLPVVRPRHIEIPRSLVQVVVYWNIPIHNWLKNYVFRTTKPFGNFAAILSTYAVSSLLHGLNFQLAAVLISLGAYTYVEYVLRQKLATVFSACVQVRPCKKDCPHSHKEKNSFVIAVNIGFGAIATFHLAYLGVMFDTSAKLQDEGYNYNHTLAKWSNLNYASHWFVLATYIFYVLI